MRPSDYLLWECVASHLLQVLHALLLLVVATCWWEVCSCSGGGGGGHALGRGRAWLTAAPWWCSICNDTQHSDNAATSLLWMSICTPSVCPCLLACLLVLIFLQPLILMACKHNVTPTLAGLKKLMANSLLILI